MSEQNQTEFTPEQLGAAAAQVEQMRAAAEAKAAPVEINPIFVKRRFHIDGVEMSVMAAAVHDADTMHLMNSDPEAAVIGIIGRDKWTEFCDAHKVTDPETGKSYRPIWDQSEDGPFRRLISAINAAVDPTKQ